MPKRQDIKKILIIGSGPFDKSSRALVEYDDGL